MCNSVTIKAKVFQSWMHGVVALPPRWEFLDLEKAARLKRPQGWYLHVRTDYGYRWIPLKDLKGEIPTPPETPPQPKEESQQDPVPVEEVVVEQAPPKETRLVEEPPKEKEDWRSVFLDAINKL